MTDYLTQFASHNSHFESPTNFKAADPDLSKLASQVLVHDYQLINTLLSLAPGIYTLCGAHQVGKTTLLKNWMNRLILSGIQASTIAYIPGHEIQDYHALKSILQKQINSMPEDKTLYLILDDANTIRDWAKSVLPLENSGVLSRVVFLAAGPDAALSEEAAEVFSTRRASGKPMDFHLYPLTFRETVKLKHGESQDAKLLFKEFEHYLIHGGFLNAINDFEKNGYVSDKIFVEYVDWIFKESLSRGKQETYLREILGAVLKHYNNQTTWNLLAQELSIDHPKTIGDYFAMLEAMDVVFVQHALLEDTLQAAPKKARKLMFADPFLFHAINARLNSTRTNINAQIKANLDNPDMVSKLVKTCAITQYQRYFPTYYIKGEGEVDLAYVSQQKFWPVEVTWTGQMRAKDLKQVLKYPNGRILTKTERSGIIQHIRTEPLPIALWQIEDTN